MAAYLIDNSSLTSTHKDAVIPLCVPSFSTFKLKFVKTLLP